jgi:hypothetical protein
MQGGAGLSGGNGTGSAFASLVERAEKASYTERKRVGRASAGAGKALKHWLYSPWQRLGSEGGQRPHTLG